MPGYTKLFSRILESTIWREDDKTRILWITMLAMANQHGIVESTIPGLADRARITLDECETALERFQQEDKYSWSKEEGGRRVRVVEGGWFLINHDKYRKLLSQEDQREKTRLRVQAYRERRALRNESVTPSNDSNDKQKQIQKQTQKQESKAEPPSDLHPLNYGRKILEEIEFPVTPDNIRAVTAAVEAEIKAGKTGPAAYEFILAGVLDAREEGLEINRFFFQDAKYRTENRRGGLNGRRSQSRSERIAERTDRVFSQIESAEDVPEPVRKRTR